MKHEMISVIYDDETDKFECKGLTDKAVDLICGGECYDVRKLFDKATSLARLLSVQACDIIVASISTVVNSEAVERKSIQLLKIIQMEQDDSVRESCAALKVLEEQEKANGGNMQ